MKHYTNKKTLEVYGYESIEDAQAFNDEFENLVEMTDELFQQYREQKPGHKWSLNGWVECKTLMSQFKAEEEVQALEQKRQIYFDMEATIQRLERIRDRDDSEQAELDALIDESTKLFREIRAEKETLNDRNA